MKRLNLAVLGLAVILGTGILSGGAVNAASAATKQKVNTGLTQESKKELKKEVKNEVKQNNKDEKDGLDKKVCEYFQTYFDSAVTAKNIISKETISKDYKGNSVIPYVVYELSDDSLKYRAVVNEEGGIRSLKAIDNKAASTTVSADDPYFKEKMAYDLKKITLPSLGKCKELALNFIADNQLAEDIELTYVGEITTDMLYSTVLYQYDENTIIFLDISSQYNKVIGFGYRNDIDKAKRECKSADYRGNGLIG